MCYSEDVPLLDLSDIRVACLVGDNGHGKSTIVDAMTWALWGKARARSDDELIHQGKREMEVELEFLLADNRYRIIRKRDKRGGGKSSLEFQLKDNGRFRPLTGDTIRQTQNKIIDLLHMDYETFINSAFLLQGRADEFTIKPPAERKRILGEILGLSLYERLEERAKERVKEKEFQLREVRAALESIERELIRMPEYEREVTEAQEIAAQLARQLRQEQGELQRKREIKRELDLKVAQVEEILQRIKEGKDELTYIEREIDLAENRLRGYQGILAQERRIEEGFASLVTAREAHETFNRKLARVAKLNEERSQLERKIAEARSALVFERGLSLERIAQLEAQIERGPSLEEELASLCHELDRLALLEEELEAKRAEERATSQEIVSLQATNQGLISDMQLLKEKLGLLKEAEAKCPLCEQDLTEIEISRIAEKYLSQGEEKGGLYRQNKRRVEELKGQLRDLQKEIRGLEGEVKKKPSLQSRKEIASQALAQVEEAENTMAQEKERLQALEERLEKNEYAKEEQGVLAALEHEIKGLGYDPQEHEEIQRRLSSLANYEAEMKELERTRQGVEATKEALERTRESYIRWQNTLAADKARGEALEKEVMELGEAVEGLEEQERLVQGLQDEESQARQALGAAQERVDRCRGLEKEKEAKVAQEREITEEKTIYEELQLAFGKKGVQAMIIESALPELEEEANRLLSRMTDGRMHLRFETQRTTKKGEPTETLEIKISDELGARSYELYSGGEAFRVNFAIRIALSKLLARRAGARLETLIIDEGFGTQDTIGRERLIEAINSIQDDFALILVITHIEELRDAFPVRIDIFKTPEGSQISMT
ncbi:MAG: SMC family ATPase [Anaerolineae bacterium]|nr:SMC family ATPase [Anaerolineae bacterium]